MKLSWRRPRLLLSAAVAVGALSGLTVAAAPAYAAGPHITVIGRPGEILVQGGGFNADATVRIEALTPDLSKVLDTIYVQANWLGYLDGSTYLNDLGGYTGKVWVLADGAPGPTAGAITQVTAEPVLGAFNSAPAACEGNVWVGGDDFPPGATVRLRLVAEDTLADTSYAAVNQDGSLLDTMPLPSGSDGTVIVIADGFPPFYGQQVWAVLAQAC